MVERRRMAEQEQAQVLVAVGTDHHPFDRLVTWVDEWAAERPELTVLIQRGTSAPAEHCRTVDLLPHPELCERFARADVVISHGGPSTVMDARMAGRLPIVVPRDPDRGEHVDDHQLRFAGHLRRHELAEVADDRAEFHRLLEEATEFPERFSLPVDDGAIGGVVEFGRVVDELLGTVTPVVPSSPGPATVEAPAVEAAAAVAESA
ncbi:MAG: glycosyltransferase [Actinomycetota bacterium]